MESRLASELQHLRNERLSSSAAYKPVLGPIPVNGTKPLFGAQHSGSDAIFALAAGYDLPTYRHFVGNLRKTGFTGDIVIAVSAPNKMKSGVAAYLERMNVTAYAFDVRCFSKDNCTLPDDFLGYPDPRPSRTFANIRYALYEYWLRFYPDTAYILILDFRDTFFQRNPFEMLPPVNERQPQLYDLRLYAENDKVTIYILHITIKYNAIRCVFIMFRSIYNVYPSNAYF